MSTPYAQLPRAFAAVVAGNMGTDYASRHSAKKKRKLLRKDGAIDADELDGVQDEEEKAGKKRERHKRPKVPLTTHPARINSLQLANGQ